MDEIVHSKLERMSFISLLLKSRFFRHSSIDFVASYDFLCGTFDPRHHWPGGRGEGGGGVADAIGLSGTARTQLTERN